MGVWKNRTAIWCACGTCALSVDKFKWTEEGMTETYIDFWECRAMPTFLTRLRLSWRLLIHGASPAGVVLDEDQRLRLIDALNAEVKGPEVS